MTLGRYTLTWHGLLEQNTFLFKRFDPNSAIGFIFVWSLDFGIFSIKKATGPMILHDEKEDLI